MKISILDDDNIQIVSLEKFIRAVNKKSEISTYGHPVEALAAFKKEENIPDILFLDILMPMMDGWEFLQMLEKNHKEQIKDLTVYVVTAKAFDAVERAKKFPMIKEVLFKPVLLDKIKSILDNS